MTTASLIAVGSACAGVQPLGDSYRTGRLKPGHQRNARLCRKMTTAKASFYSLLALAFTLTLNRLAIVLYRHRRIDFRTPSDKPCMKLL